MKYEIWWETEGSAMRPFPNEDIEEFSKRITAIAWSNGEYVEREACAKVAEDTDRMVLALLNVTSQPKHIANAIRARGEA